MSRQILDERQLHSAIREKVDTYGASLVGAVKAAVAEHCVVIVGMRQNPHPRRARRLLEAAAVPHHYLEYGSYFSQWRDRLALKLWTGWTTFPMIFVQGQLIGGADELERLQSSGELARLLAAPRS